MTQESGDKYRRVYTISYDMHYLDQRPVKGLVTDGYARSQMEAIHLLAIARSRCRSFDPPEILHINLVEVAYPDGSTCKYECHIDAPVFKD